MIMSTDSPYSKQLTFIPLSKSKPEVLTNCWQQLWCSARILLEDFLVDAGDNNEEDWDADQEDENRRNA